MEAQNPPQEVTVQEFKFQFYKTQVINVKNLESNRGDLQETILFLRTPTHVTHFAAKRPCPVARVTKKRLATSLYGRHEDFCLLRG